MANDLTRRALIAGLATGAAALTIAGPASAALDVNSARDLIGRLVGDINKIINSGESQTQMYADFGKLFDKYADVNIIARSTLGPAARSASPAELKAYTAAFRDYMSRKYGARFREFIGGKIEVQNAREVNGFYEVNTVAKLQGQQPFQVIFDVSDKSGRNLFFNIIIEGINLLAAERQEVGAMLDQSGGNISALVQKLKTAN